MVTNNQLREYRTPLCELSASVPSGAPSVPLNARDLRPGIWNVLPVLEADHMFLLGGLMRRHEIRPFYLELLKLIRATEKNSRRSFSG